MIKYLKIGQIVNTQGLKGDMRVYPLTDYKERFEEIGWVYIGDDFNNKYKIINVRYKSNLVILKLEGIDDINEVEKLRNKYLFIPRENARELDEDEHFISDLIGMKVYTVDGVYVGELKNVILLAANDVYEIISEDGREFLIPALKKFIPSIDMDERKIIIDPIKGMLD